MKLKMSDLKDKTLVELNAMGREKRHEIFQLRLQQAGSRLENPSRLRILRRDVARIETRISALRRQPAPSA